jgi:hypothetical protein
MLPPLRIGKIKLVDVKIYVEQGDFGDGVIAALALSRKDLNMAKYKLEKIEMQRIRDPRTSTALTSKGSPPKASANSFLTLRRLPGMCPRYEASRGDESLLAILRQRGEKITVARIVR